jgi:hypothetical protein
MKRYIVVQDAIVRKRKRKWVVEGSNLRPWD